MPPHLNRLIPQTIPIMPVIVEISTIAPVGTCMKIAVSVFSSLRGKYIAKDMQNILKNDDKSNQRPNTIVVSIIVVLMNINSGGNKGLLKNGFFIIHHFIGSSWEARSVRTKEWRRLSW